MPGIIKRPSLDRLNMLLGRSESSGSALQMAEGSISPRSSATMISNMLMGGKNGMMKAGEMGKVSYIPAQMDPLSTTSTRWLQHNPLNLMMMDMQMLLKCLRFAPMMVMPMMQSPAMMPMMMTSSGEMKAEDGKCELRPSMELMKTIMLQGMLCTVEMVLMMACVPAMMMLPGMAFAMFAACALMLVQSMSWPLNNGSRFIFSRMDKMTKSMAEHHRDERWVFINGAATSRSGLQDSIDRISRVFGRNVMGVHNRTHGFVADMAECMMQRTMGYNTACVRQTHDQIKAMLCDPTVTKVCLMGHGSGAMTISMVLDHLYDELHASDMAKLEIYTFASAASSFLSPRLMRASGQNAMMTNGNLMDHHDNNDERNNGMSMMQRDCPYIEHYANENDMMSRWGVLYGSREIPSNRYGGAVFMQTGTAGHLFNQHYLNPMFGQAAMAMPMKGMNQEGMNQGASGEMKTMMHPFLDQTVMVDEATVARREGAALEKVGIMRRESGMEFENVQRMAGMNMSMNMNMGMMNMSSVQKPGDLMMAFERTASGQLVTDEARGKTVRELSRLWRYQGGKSPEGNTVNGFHYHDEEQHHS